MSESALIIGIVGVLVIILIVIFKGQKIKKIKFSELEAEFASDSKSLILITKIPDRVAWFDLTMKLNGRSVCRIKAKDQGGQEIAKEVVVKNEGEAHYSIKASGSQRLYNSQGQLTPVDYNAIGSGQINIVFGGKFIIHEITELEPGGAKFSLCLDSYDNYESSLLPDDIAEAEINRMIDEA